MKHDIFRNVKVEKPVLNLSCDTSIIAVRLYAHTKKRCWPEKICMIIVNFQCQKSQFFHLTILLLDNVF